MNKEIFKSKYETFLSLGLIVFVSILAYALLIPKLGLYWDGWLHMWWGYSHGPISLAQSMVDNRLFVGWVFAFNHWLTGTNLIFLHIYIFIVRLLGILALWWGIRGLWPEQRFATTAIVLFFAVYPGFLLQSMPGSFQAYFIPLTISIASISFTIRAELTESKKQYILLTTLAVLLAIIYLFILEIFIGMELLRVALIFYIAYRKKEYSLQASIIYTIKHWIPYLLVIFLFLFWRVYLYTPKRDTTNVRYVLEQYVKSPSKIVQIPISVLKGVLRIALFVWFVAANSVFLSADGRGFITSVLLVVVGGGAVVVYSYFLQKYGLMFNPDEKDKFWVKDVAILGLFIILGSIFPIILAGRNILSLTEVDVKDRYAIMAIVGSSMVAGSSLFMFRASVRPWVLAFLIGISIATQFTATNIFRQQWNVQKNLLWQLSWRAPQIKTGTTVVFNSNQGNWGNQNNEGWNRTLSYNSTVSSINMFYNFVSKQTLIYTIPLDRVTLRMIEKGYVDKFRPYKFPANDQFLLDFSKILVVDMSRATSCIHVLDGKRKEFPIKKYPSQVVEKLRLAANYSQPDLFITDAPQPEPPTSIFGNEPAHTWCYYFQKADLASQLEDWQTVAELGDKARDKGYKPTDKTEWLPFIEGYNNVGRYSDVTDIAELILPTPSSNNSDSKENILQPTLCKLIVDRLKNSETDNADQFLQDFPARCKNVE